MSKLYKTSRFYRTLHVDIKGKQYKLNSFVFYNDKGIIFNNSSGYLDNDMEVSFDFEIKRKLKESFDKKDAYILKSKGYYDDNGYDLYIHSDLVGLKEPTYSVKYNRLIMAKYETDIKDFTFDIYKKALDRDLNIIKKQIEEECNNLKSYELNSDMLQDTINKLQELQVKLKEEEDKLNSYTIEDYLDEIKVCE